jgi:lysophospholipase L1-like esterase
MTMAVIDSSKFRVLASAAFFWLSSGYPFARGAKCDPAAVQAITHPNDHSSITPERRVQLAKRLHEGSFDVLALGDSIMAGWPEAELAGVFKGSVVNLGFGTDGAEHTLWRLDDFDWSKQHPKYVLLLVGTNDMHFPACAVEVGLPHLIGSLRVKFPGARLIVTSILPRGLNFSDRDDAIQAVNARLAADAKRGGYWFLNVHDAFECQHRASCELFLPGNRHLTAEGYALLERRLAQLLANGGTAP